jgi:hypothetical protein
MRDTIYCKRREKLPLKNRVLWLKWVGQVIRIFENGIPKRDIEGSLAEKGPSES